MLKESYLKQVRRALRQQGIWGTTAHRFEEELSDHFDNRVQALQEGAMDRATAEIEALRVLGTPSNIAEASREILSASLPSRHPWLVSGLGIFMLVEAALIGLSALLWIYGPSVPHVLSHSGCVYFFVAADILCNWVPWLLGLGLLAWIFRCYPMGWRSLIIACFALGIASTSIQWWVYLPDNGHGSMDFNHQFWTRPLFWLADRSFAPGIYQGCYPCLVSPSDPQVLVKLWGPLLACCGFRYLSSFRREGLAG